MQMFSVNPIVIFVSACILVMSLTGGAFGCRADELDSLVSRALQDNPSIRAARLRVDQVYEQHEELLGFFDPEFYAAGGAAERARGVPGSSDFETMTNNANEIKTGVEMAMEPGFYLAVGGAERFLKEPGSGYNHLYQTLGGVRVRVPLGQDRGFCAWDFKRSKALADYGAAASDLLDEMQVLRHSVATAYISVLEAKAQLEVAQEATRRFQSLLDEAQELSRLKVIPDYQLSPAQMEVALRASEEASARQTLDTAITALAKLIGSAVPVEIQADPTFLLEETSKVKPLEEVSPDDAALRRGSYRQILNQLEAARANLRIAQENLRETVELQLGATWQGEDKTDISGEGTALSDEHLGTQAILVWTRPLGFRAERSVVRRLTSRISELKELLAVELLDIQSELSTYRTSYERSRERLEIVSNAMAAGMRTLDAERERFRLGEGRSRNVLDAQKDVTSIGQRQATAAADVLRARNNFMYAKGYVFDLVEPMGAAGAR